MSTDGNDHTVPRRNGYLLPHNQTADSATISSRGAPRSARYALERGIPHYKLILLSTPASYGKTTLLAQWARASRFPIAWLSIDAEDNGLDRCFRYLLAAWEKLQPGVGESPLGLLLGGMSPNSEAVLSAFINVANDVPDHMVFVLDDYHLIEDLSIHQALTFLLDHLPPMLHLVLAGRADPPLPLARYRAHSELIEFRAENLQFFPEETTEFLNETMGLDLARDHVVRMQTQLEGWIAGLQFVTRNLQRHRAGIDPLVVTGRQRFIADYLREDVLAQLPEDVRRFLLQTSILNRLCQPVCAAVTGRQDSQALLERLERENVFLVPLDDNREWFRYHQIFADFLQEELNRRHPDEVAQLHRRAGSWYLAHDLPAAAFQHAVRGNDVDLVIRILERYLTIMLNFGEIKVVAGWLDSLPTTWYSSHPLLNLFRSGVLGVTGAFDACLRCIDENDWKTATLRRCARSSPHGCWN